MKREYCLIISLLFFFSNLNAQDFTVITKEIQASFTSQSAIDSLKTGNVRFINDSQIHRSLIEEAKLTAHKQFPFAVTLSCMDSRTPSEFIFDQGIGSIFNLRVAGNIVNEDILGSLEYACKVTGAKLIVVLGHENCGAIKGACDDVKLGNLTELLNKIQHAVDSVKETDDRTSHNHEFVKKVTKENVILGIKQIKKQSPILKEMLDKGEIGIVGAMYDLDTGIVTFYED